GSALHATMPPMRPPPKRPIEGTVADLMSMAKKVYPWTFAKTDDVDAAADLLAERIESRRRATVEDPALESRKFAIWLWAGCWARAFFPLVQLDERVAVELLRGPDADPRKITATSSPWPSYLIAMPPGLLAAEGIGRIHPIDLLLVFHGPEESWIATQTR